jgi:hypothetical protein
VISYNFCDFQFNNIFNTIFSSPPTVAIMVGTLLDHTIDAKHTVNDRGFQWWLPFQKRDGDHRNDEFYSFPLNYLPSSLSEFVPRIYVPRRFF